MKSFTFPHSPQLQFIRLGLPGGLGFFLKLRISQILQFCQFLKGRKKTHLSLQRPALHQPDLQPACHNHQPSSVQLTVHLVFPHEQRTAVQWVHQRQEISSRAPRRSRAWVSCPPGNLICSQRSSYWGTLPLPHLTALPRSITPRSIAPTTH